MFIEENRTRQEARNRDFAVKIEALEEALKGLREELISLRRVQEEGLRRVLSAFQEFLSAAMEE